MPYKKIVVTASILFFALPVFFSGLLVAQEKRIQKTDLPSAVQKTADEQSKGATVKGYNKEVENGKVEYEVELLMNGHAKDVSMDEQGNVLEVEEEVSLPSLPADIREGLQRKAGKGTIRKVESLTKHGSLVAYEAQVITAGKRTEIQVGPDGKPLDHKE
jgi:uncharacterized membrane protein YkoI